MRVHVEHVAWVTGQDSPNRTGDHAGVYHTDLGICWDDGRGGVLVAFGDTYGEGWPGHGPGAAWWKTKWWSLRWRTNVLARSTHRDLREGMRLHSWVQGRGWRAGQVIPRANRLFVREHTLIPTAGVSVGGRQYLAYMSVRRWGGPGRWRTNHAGIAHSDDGGVTWHKPRAARWANTPDGEQNWQLCAFARDRGFVHVFGTPNGRFGPARLARVPEDALPDHHRWTYWTGEGWLADEGRAVDVLPAPVSELSVMFHRASGQWLAAYLHEGLHDIVVCTADAVTGPWSAPVATGAGARWPGLYNAYFHPWSADLDTPYFLMSQWDPYNVMLMRLHL
ncbi:MAG TPA: DUF4185 domain-containing protein [Pseudonocardia sp.]|nr:DUF4185 domain-containing protein [Pseudonocardia sp.]